jgi:hypothetical protein
MSDDTLFAFPRSPQYTRVGDEQHFFAGDYGMTLRDYFAAQAMTIVPPMSAYNMKANERQQDYVARVAYEMADAFLKARIA